MTTEELTAVFWICVLSLPIIILLPALMHKNEEAEVGPVLPTKPQKKPKPFPVLAFTDQVLIAGEAIKSFPLDEYEAVKDMLSAQGEKRQVIEELNSKIKSQYEARLVNKIGTEFATHTYVDSRKEELEKIIPIGLRALMKEHAPDNVRDSSGAASREIKSSESWEDIKRRL